MDSNPNSGSTPVGRMCLTISFILEAAVEAGTITEEQRRKLWLAVWSVHRSEDAEDA